MLGEIIATLTDRAEPAVRLQFPNHQERCKSCAFKHGTYPNGCLPTVMDAVKAIVENVPFMCHQKFDANGNPTELCAGYAIAMAEIQKHPLPDALKKATADWEFSK